MSDLPITLTCADYARIMPLATGEVKPDGIALTMILGSRGSWPARAEMLRRAVQDPAVQGGEWSMAQYLYRIDNGDRRYVGLPVFPLRNFTARDLYVRRGGPIRSAADLAGKRIGMYSYTASGSIWYRPSCASSAWIRLRSSGGSATSTRPGRRRWTRSCRPVCTRPPRADRCRRC
jgi:4,5-dihydroxyphthalate decarboxylase